jgi:hypothetical protein
MVALDKIKLLGVNTHTPMAAAVVAAAVVHQEVMVVQ